LSISEKFKELRGEVLFHYTHEDNIESIKQKDWIIYSSSQIGANGVNPSFITDSDSRNIDSQRGYNNYVFLVFTHSHPMLFRKGQEGIPMKYYSINISILDIPGVLIADRVATDNSVNLYTPAEALKKLDIGSCHDNLTKFTQDWYNVRDFEILIPGYIDLKKYFHRP
jgi:hypothetical protein